MPLECALDIVCLKNEIKIQKRVTEQKKPVNIDIINGMRIRNESYKKWDEYKTTIGVPKESVSDKNNKSREIWNQLKTLLPSDKIKADMPDDI